MSQSTACTSQETSHGLKRSRTDVGPEEAGLECPVCLLLIEPPAFQCAHGHPICGRCLDTIEAGLPEHRICPSCRTLYASARIRCLIAESYNSLVHWTRKARVGERLRQELMNLNSGAYVSSTIISLPESQEHPEVTLHSGTYFQVDEARHCEGDEYVRGRLPDGRWIDLANATSGYRFANPVPHGAYVTAARETAVGTGDRRSSSTIATLAYGAHVEVVETKFISEDERVRGRLQGGGWISLVNSTNDFRWAKPVVLGAYTVLATACKMTSGPSLSSVVIRELARDVLVEVLETKFLEEEALVRARIKAGGWINLLSTADGTRWAEPVPLGTFVTVAATTLVSAAVKLQSEPLRKLSSGSIVELVEARFVEEDQRVRGRLQTEGWISMVDTATGFRWVSPVQQGPLE